MTISSGSRLFLDTNILLGATDELRKNHAFCLQVLQHWPQRGVHLHLSGQVLREYLVVATRPIEANGLGLTLSQATENVRTFLTATSLCPETELVCQRLLQLAEQYTITGKHLHDLNIVATMQINGLQDLLTANPTDFTHNLPIHVHTPP